jgi:hypothetical protein
VSLLGEDGSRALLLLKEHGGGKNSGAGNVVLLLRVDGGGNHGVKFLPELGSLAGIIGGHRRWCRGAQEGDAATGDAAEGERAADP